MEKLTEKQKKLVEDNIKLVPYTMNRYFSTYKADSKEEMYGDAYLALVLAAKNYKEENGVSFSTYAVKTVALYVLRCYRRRLLGDRGSNITVSNIFKAFHLAVEDGDISVKNAYKHYSDLSKYPMPYRNFCAVASMYLGSCFSEDLAGKGFEVSDDYSQNEIGNYLDKYGYEVWDLIDYYMSLVDRNKSLSKRSKDVYRDYLIEIAFNGKWQGMGKALAKKYNSTPSNISQYIQTGNKNLQRELAKEKMTYGN